MKNMIPSTLVLPGRVPASSLALALAVIGCATADSNAPMIVAADPTASDPGQTRSITVSIDAIESTGGDIRVALYSTAPGFDANEPIRSVSEPATGPAVTVSFEDVPDGDYAVMLYHDVNGNETLDRNLLGIPREPWAGSLNRSVFGAPDWDDVRFEMDGTDLALSLSL